MFAIAYRGLRLNFDSLTLLLNMAGSSQESMQDKMYCAK